MTFKLENWQKIKCIIPVQKYIHETSIARRVLLRITVCGALIITFYILQIF